MLLETQTALDVQLVTTIDALQALAPEWLALWRQDVRATPFQSPAWLVPWARHFTGGDLLCVALRQAGELVGLVPTFIWTIPETGQRQLVLLGTGISDYVDGVFAPGLATAGGHAALAWLIRHADCDAINFEQLRPDSPLACNVAGLDPQTPCPVLSLPACVADLGAHVPSGQLQNVRYYRRRAQRIGELQFDTPCEETLDDFMAELYALHSARWHGVQRRGVLCHDSIQSFHREACRGLFDTGSLRLYRLRCRGESVAVFYGFAAHRRTYYYLAGFAPKFASLSPGTLLIAHAIERAILEGSEAFDFLRGTERYKYLWGAKDTPTYRRSISRPELTPV